MTGRKKRNRTNVLINALRCTCTPGAECIGERCQFWTTEPVPEDLRERFGEDEFGSCDADAIGIAAADRLEELLELNRRKNALLAHMGITIPEENDG